MKLLNDLIVYVIIFIIILVFMAVLFYLLLLLYKKKESRELKGQKSNRDIDLEDAELFTPIEDILEDMIIESGKKRFIAVIKCIGYDFYTSPRSEQVRIQNNYVNFISALSEPITYRQFGENIDLNQTIKMYDSVYNKLESRYFNLFEDYKELEQLYQQEVDQEKKQKMRSLLLSMKKQLSSYVFRLEHLDDQRKYFSKVSGQDAGKQKIIQSYIIDWCPDKNIFDKNLTEEETINKAIIELDNLCCAKIKQLEDAGTIATRCNTMELIDLFRKHNQPISGNRITIQQILNDTSFFDQIVTTKSIDRINDDLERDLAEEIIMGDKI